MNFELLETDVQQLLRPLSAACSVGDLRLGILSIREKWAYFLREVNRVGVICEVAQIPAPGCRWVCHENRITLTGSEQDFRTISRPWHFFQYNDWAIRADWQWVTHQRASAPLSPSNTVIESDQVFIEPGASVECSIINASEGPVYIGRNATVMEGCLIRGPVAVGEGATLKMGTKIYGATTIGPYCVAGGEIKNSLLMAYSNKAHDGYLGDSVIGRWCNLGAGTTNSNLKNTAGTVSMWHQATAAWESVGIKGGLIMGDYSRAAINTSFNTGTVVGVCCNLFGEAAPSRFVPDFSWGTERYELDKAISHLRNWKSLKGQSVTDEEIIILKQLYHQTI